MPGKNRLLTFCKYFIFTSNPIDFIKWNFLKILVSGDVVKLIFAYINSSVKIFNSNFL